MVVKGRNERGKAGGRDGAKGASRKTTTTVRHVAKQESLSGRLVCARQRVKVHARRSIGERLAKQVHSRSCCPFAAGSSVCQGIVVGLPQGKQLRVAAGWKGGGLAGFSELLV
jgi:hypothetical protein